MTRHVLSVLFVCPDGAARSLMAESLLRDWGRGRFRSFSAGLFPAEAGHPLALDLLAEQGILMPSLTPRPLATFTASAELLDFVFTLASGLDERLPPLPGAPVVIDWSMEDPALVDGSRSERMIAFREAFHILENRIKVLVALPLHRLTRLAVKTEMDRIRAPAPA